MNDKGSQFYEFGPFRLDVRRRLLWRGGDLIPLASKVFETMLVLVRNSGREMLKADLMNLIWPDSFVEEGNLAQNICTLRKALREELGGHQYIVTVPGRGYRFVAEVREFAFEEWEPPKEDTISTIRISDYTNSIAVIPFKPIAGNDDAQHLGVGLADSIILRLSSQNNVSVRPITSVLRYGDRGQDPIVAGRELGVGIVLDGIYQRTSDKIRVTAHLIRIRDGATLWAAKFDESVSDVFGLQDSIAEQLVPALVLPLNLFLLGVDPRMDELELNPCFMEFLQALGMTRYLDGDESANRDSLLQFRTHELEPSP